MPDFRNMKLGRKAVKTDTRTLRLSRYLTAELPAPPPSVDWTKGITQWGMMLNDSLGDCTIAALGHAIQVWTANTGAETTVPDSVILGAYEAWDGYVPNDPSTDNGGVELDVLNKFKQQGLAGEQLLAFADPQASNLTEVQQSIALFGGVYIGITLTNAQLQQQVWDVIPNDDSGIAGGHAVFVPKYDTDGSFTCITWGELMKMTPAFWQSAVDEVHTLLSPAWIAANGAPSGFDLSQLQTDLAAIQ